MMRKKSIFHHVGNTKGEYLITMVIEMTTAHKVLSWKRMISAALYRKG